MKLVETLAAAFGLAVMANGHMEMKSPPPFRSKFNPNTGSDIDYSMTSPLSASGSDFPCKGYHKLVGTPEGKPVAEWSPGQTYKMTITGGTPHNGGSCQASVSFDNGSTWKVVHSYVGNCPVMGDSDYSFTLPNDTPAGDMIFAWTWFNQVGNREMYMNCAAITVKANAKRSSRVDRRGASDPISSRPAMFVANVGNGLCTVEGKDVLFPSPGPDVDINSTNTAGPQQNCDVYGGGKAPAGSETQSQSGPASQSAPPGGVFVTAPTSAGAAPTTATNVEPDSPSTTAGAEAPPATLTTMTTAVPTTMAAPKPSSQPSQPSSPSSPQPSPQPSAQPSSTPSAPSDGGSGSVTTGTACDTEGEWNCVGGKQFQRCASGSWSALIPMAAGTSCAPGKGQSLVMTKKRSSDASKERRFSP